MLQKPGFVCFKRRRMHGVATQRPVFTPCPPVRVWLRLPSSVFPFFFSPMVSLLCVCVHMCVCFHPIDSFPHHVFSLQSLRLLQLSRCCLFVSRPSVPPVTSLLSTSHSHPAASRLPPVPAASRRLTPVSAPVPVPVPVPPLVAAASGGSAASSAAMTPTLTMTPQRRLRRLAPTARGRQNPGRALATNW